MASYTPPTLSGYNATPPPDDGSQTGPNEVAWDKHIDKIGDPLKNFSEAIDSAVTTAFSTIDSQLLTDSNKYDEDTGVADAYVVTLSPAISSYVEGHMFRMKIGAGNTNTGASTVAINGLAAQDIKTPDGADPQANDLLSGGIYQFVYDGTNYIVNQRAKDPKNTFVNLGTGEPAISTTLLTFTQANLGAVWEGVGPTASGEPNIWTALDGVPSDVDWIKVYVRYEANRANVSASGKLFVRANGSTAAADNTTEIISVDSAVGGGTSIAIDNSSEATIQVSSRVFDIQTTGVSDTFSVLIRLIGYGYN